VSFLVYDITIQYDIGEKSGALSLSINPLAQVTATAT